MKSLLGGLRSNDGISNIKGNILLCPRELAACYTKQEISGKTLNSLFSVCVIRCVSVNLCVSSFVYIHTN